MKEDIKNSWVKALRSCEYPQTTSYLKSCDGFCCLGVLTDLYLKEKGYEWDHLEVDNKTVGVIWSTDPKTLDSEYPETYELPEAVRTWAGMKSSSGYFVTNSGRHIDLAEENDNGTKFDRIAELIEANWQYL